MLEKFFYKSFHNIIQSILSHENYEVYIQLFFFFGGITTSSYTCHYVCAYFTTYDIMQISS